MSKRNFKIKLFPQLQTLFFFFLISSTTASRPVTSTVKTAAHTLSFIKSSCLIATYPDICTRTLSTHADEINPPTHQTLATKSLFLALTAAKSSHSFFRNLCKLPRLMSPAVMGPVRDCRVMIGDAVRQLKRSVKEMGRPIDVSGTAAGDELFEMRISDVQSWVSAALTDLNTCMDPFEGRMMDGKVKVMVKREVGRVFPLISNALALVNSYSASMKTNSNHGRRHP